MKKIILLLLSIVIFSCSDNKHFTKEDLAENTMEALQDNNLEQFKKSLPTIKELEEINEFISPEYYDNYVTDLFLECKEEFSKLELKASDFEIFKINEPNKISEIMGVESIEFNVILKNDDDVFLKAEFEKIIKTTSGYKFSKEEIDLSKS